VAPKTTAMCWQFVGSALFSGVFAIKGGWVLSLHITPGYIHAAVASNHFGAGLAARMDRNHLMTSLFLFAVLAFLVSALCRLFLRIAADASRSGR